MRALFYWYMLCDPRRCDNRRKVRALRRISALGAPNVVTWTKQTWIKHHNTPFHNLCYSTSYLTMLQGGPPLHVCQHMYRARGQGTVRRLLAPLEKSLYLSPAEFPKHTCVSRFGNGRVCTNNIRHHSCLTVPCHRYSVTSTEMTGEVFGNGPLALFWK